MDEELLEPLEGYKSYYKDKFKEEAEKYFLELKDKSKIDVDANHETIKELNAAKEENDKINKKLNKMKTINTMFIFFIIIGILGTIFSIFLITKAESKTVPIVILVVAIILLISGIIGKFSGISKKIKALKELLENSNVKIDELIKKAKAQMAPLNALFDWNIPVLITKRTIPTLELDQFFDAKKYYYLKKRYGLKHSNPKASTEYVQSGTILGNPFILCRDYTNYIYKKTYSNSITIHWTTTVHTKDGTRTVHHSQTLTAYVHADAPGYYHSTYLIYGNEAAPHLKFSRMPTNVENMSDKELQKYVKKESKKLNKLETKSLTDKNPKTNYSRFGNDEFETIFGGTDRNNDVEFNLLFTPLAQANMLKLLKDKEKIGYGDDFAFEKENCLNLVQSEHSQRIDYRANPIIFTGYDFDKMQEFFIDFNTKWFKSFYFDLAPLLSIPLYQQHKSKEFIYDEPIDANLSEYEYEVMANQFDPELLKHEDAITPNIYKTEFIKSKGNSDEFKITAHAFRGERRVTYVTKWGGDGRSHVIPVRWIEYFPVEKETNMIINKNNQSRFEYNSKDHSKYGDIHSHFERGLVGFLGYQALFDADTAVEASVAKEGFNLEETIVKLEEELDRQDKANKEFDDNNIDESKLGEEKETSEDDVEVDTDDDSDNEDGFDDEESDEFTEEVLDEEDND